MGALGMLWAIRVIEQLTSGSKVSKQIIIKEKKLNYAIVRKWGEALYLLVQTLHCGNEACARLLVVNKEK